MTSFILSPEVSPHLELMNSEVGYNTGYDPPSRKPSHCCLPEILSGKLYVILIMVQSSVLGAGDKDKAIHTNPCF